VDIGLILPMGDDDRPGVPVSSREILAMAAGAEAAGLDSLWVYDHLIAEEDGRVSGIWEAWTLLGALAASTASARLGTLVTCTSFRHPPLLAKMAHTLQEISGGRLTLGLGAGWHQPEYRAFGYPFDRRVSRFAEAIEIIATLLREGRTTFTGDYYTVEDCALLPPLTAGAVRTPILVGCGGGGRMLRLTARFADSWNTAWYGLPDERFAELRGKLHAACMAEERDPATVDVTVGLILGGRDRPGRVEVEASAVAEALAAWEREGVSEVICWPDPTDAASVEVLLAGVRAWRDS
jgi:alkanesulfonate monooxygenase SsuD/methylene tetrahydromethanopterin reductase-like flavin-dependent oxidoreductase (luciferase family)